MSKKNHSLRLKKLGIDTYKEMVVYVRKDAHVCRSEGFESQARVQVKLGEHCIIATLNTIDSALLLEDEASLSNYAWDLLGAKEGDEIFFSHPKPLRSLSFIRSKIYGNELNNEAIISIVSDVVKGRLSDVHISALLTACATNKLNKSEIISLTNAMVEVGQRIQWPKGMVVDKHCVGGLPGNRTSLIVVPIVASYGLTVPKTSSRAITSPAGTADTMEVLAPVNLDIAAMRKVIEQENGCLVWGGSVALSPADDILIRVERALELDSEGQLVASILSKKIAAGSTHIIIDIPIGPTAKVRTLKMANNIKGYLESVASALGVTVLVIITDGSQPIGRGIGPALEAKDVLTVLRNDPKAPKDLRERALMLAGHMLEFLPTVSKGTGKQLAESILDSGKAWSKFQGICHAQGGMFSPPSAKFVRNVVTKAAGKVVAIDNRRLAKIAKLAGAPDSKAAGVELYTPLSTSVEKGQLLFTIHSDTQSELEYALSYFEHEKNIIHIETNL